MKRLASYRVLIAFSLIILIIIGGVFLLQRQPWSKKPLEITLITPASSPLAEMKVYVGGAVLNPGWYPFEEGDCIEDILSMAGGCTSNAAPAKIELYVCENFESGESVAPQLVSISRADAWLLDALPGIGPSLAQNIVQYREENGPFVMTQELLLVPGIGEAKYDGLKDLITVE
jgi:competence protein ComEA